MARWLALSLVVIGAAACAAVLGIDDRDLISEQEGGAGIDGAIDGPGDRDIADGDGGVVLDSAGDGACGPSNCGAAGGSCVNGSCALYCDAGCKDSVFNCPPGLDCTVGCLEAGACESARCVGGRSCTFDCKANGTCQDGISCESQRCEFNCTAKDSCKDGILRCDAGVCIASCANDDACNKGVSFRASEYCGVTCSGSPSCNSDMSSILCIAPDASIVCTDVMDSCKDGKPRCYGDYCSIKCLNDVTCTKNYCCEAGTCVIDVDASGNRMNVCP